MRKIDYHIVQDRLYTFEKTEPEGKLGVPEFWAVIEDRFGIRVDYKELREAEIIDENKYLFFLLKYGYEND